MTINRVLVNGGRYTVLASFDQEVELFDVTHLFLSFEPLVPNTFYIKDDTTPIRETNSIHIRL